MKNWGMPSDGRGALWLGSCLLLTMLAIPDSTGEHARFHEYLLPDPITGEKTELSSIVARLKELWPVIQEKEKTAHSGDERARLIDLLTKLGGREPALVYTPKRIERYSGWLLSEKEDLSVLGLTILAFLENAADFGKLGDREMVAKRVKRCFLRTSDWALAYFLCRLAPDDPSLEATIRAAQGLDKRQRRALLAAAGNEQALLELIAQFDLENRSEDMKLYSARFRAIDDLGRALDVRAVGPLMEILPLNLWKPANYMDVGYAHLSVDVEFALAKILAVYPDAIKKDEIPETKDGFLKWWKDKGQHIPGLDIRKTEECGQHRWKKVFPILLPPLPPKPAADD